MEVRLDAGVLAGQALIRLGRWNEAETRLKAVADDAQALGDAYRLALAFNNLGMRLLYLRRLDEALAWFTRVLSMDDVEETSVYGLSLNNAGACYARLGQFERALEMQRRAVALHEKRGAASPYEQALGELGSTYVLMEDLARGVPYLTKALAVAEQAGLNGDAALWARNLAAAYVHEGRWDDAERFNEEARRLTPANTGRVLFSTLHAADIAAGRGNDDRAIQLFQQILKEPEAEAALQWAAHDGLATIARRSGDARGAAVQYDAALKTLERTRAGLVRTDDRLSFAARLARFYQAYVDFLVERSEVEQALTVAESSRGRVLAERHGVNAPAVAAPGTLRQLAAASRSVLVSYWLEPGPLVCVDDRRPRDPVAHAARCFRDRGAGSSTSRGHSRRARRSTRSRRRRPAAPADARRARSRLVESRGPGGDRSRRSPPRTQLRNAAGGGLAAALLD